MDTDADVTARATSQSTSTTPSRASEAIAGLSVAVAFIAAIFFRVHHLFRVPLWLDEAYTAYNAGKGFAFIWRVVPLYETHPPLYYSLVRLWELLFGDSLAALRTIGVVAGVLTVIVAAFAGDELARIAELNRRITAVFAALLAAITPLLIEMSREVRPYPVLILAYAAGIWSILRIRRESSLLSLAMYAIALEATLWLHALGLIFGGSLVLALIAATLGRIDWKKTAAVHAIVALLYLPAFLILLHQRRTWSEAGVLGVNWSGVQWKLAFLWGAISILAVIALLFLVTSAVIALARRRAGGTAAGLLIAAILPPAVSIVISLSGSPVFFVRTLTPVGFPALLLAAAGLAIPGRIRWIAWVAALLLVAQSCVYDVSSLRARPREEWYAAIQWLQQRFSSGDVVYAYPNEGALPFERAAADRGLKFPCVAIPTPVPAPHVPGAIARGNQGVLALPPPMLRAIARSPHTESYSTIWLLRLGGSADDINDTFLKELLAVRRPVDRFKRGAIDMVGLRK